MMSPTSSTAKTASAPSHGSAVLGAQAARSGMPLLSPTMLSAGSPNVEDPPTTSAPTKAFDAACSPIPFVDVAETPALRCPPSVEASRPHTPDSPNRSCPLVFDVLALTPFPDVDTAT